MPYLPVHLNTLRPGQPVTFDIHLKLSGDDDHFIHYVKKDDDLDLDRLQKLQKKGVKKVFISDADEELYLDYLDAGLDDLEEAKLPTGDKALLTKGALQTQAENAERALETEKGYGRLQGQLGKIIGFFVSDRGAFKGMLAASGIAADVSQHSANVASIALGIATLSGISESRELLDLGVAALVHDLGARKLGVDPIATREALQGDALRRYLGHPMESVGLLAGKPFITPRVLALVADHEEIGEGLGYPEKKRIEKLPPISQILNLSNAFDKFCMSRGAPAKEALDPFFEKYGECFVLEHVTVLTTVVTSR